MAKPAQWLFVKTDLKMKLKSDKFRKARGGSAKLLELLCEKCGYSLFYYQKDGPGILKRLYVDRIVSTSKMPSGKALTCAQCKTLIAVPTIYAKEGRPAFRLFAGAIVKKVVRLNTLRKKQV